LRPETIGTALGRAQQLLAALPDTHPALEASVLLSSALDCSRSHLLAWPERTMSAHQLQRFERALARRLDGEPMAYILRRREFWSLELEVTRDTLIPRPETELLVELALRLLPASQPCRVLELGTGSGAIAAALASERPCWAITATERSAAALAVAERNFRRLRLKNVRSLPSDWFDGLEPLARFHLIVSNPPYVSAGDPHLRHGGLVWEPSAALIAGRDGLAALQCIAATAPRHLMPRGWVLLEHGYDQGTAVRRLLRAQAMDEIASYRDLAGIPRATGGRTRASHADREVL